MIGGTRKTKRGGRKSRRGGTRSALRRFALPALLGSAVLHMGRRHKSYKKKSKRNKAKKSRRA